MTPIAGRNPVKRKTSVFVKDGSRKGELVVTLHPEFMTLRIGGTRQEEVVAYESAFFSAIKARAFQAKMRKAKERKEKADAAAATRAYMRLSTRSMKGAQA